MEPYRWSFQCACLVCRTAIVVVQSVFLVLVIILILGRRHHVTVTVVVQAAHQLQARGGVSRS